MLGDRLEAIVLASEDAQLDESTLTGESLPARRHAPECAAMDERMNNAHWASACSPWKIRWVPACARLPIHLVWLELLIHLTMPLAFQDLPEATSTGTVSSDHRDQRGGHHRVECLVRACRVVRRTPGRYSRKTLRAYKLSSAVMLQRIG